MKKILLLTLSCLFGLVLGASAQEETEYTRKTWDFSKGISNESRTDLDADKTNWSIDATDANDGRTTRWKDAQKLTGILKANGNVIKELDGISWGSAGLSKNNNILIFENKVRVTRKNMEFTLKTKVKGGQTISMTYQSANATATNRGIHCKTPGVILTQGEEIALGNQAEGGQQGWGEPRVWTVDASVTEPMEVTFQMAPDGGIEIQSIIIDNGDEPEVEEAKKIAFVYGASEGYDLDSDFSWIAVSSSGSFEAEAIKISDITAETDLLAYDAVVMAGNLTFEEMANYPQVAAAPLFVPALSLGLKDGDNIVPTESNTITVNEAYLEHPMFEGVEMEDGVITLDAPVSVIELDEEDVATSIVVGTTEEKPSIVLTAPNRNAFVILPAAVSQSEIAMTLVPAVISYIASTKKAPAATTKPVIKSVQKDGATTIEMTAAKGATIYYTLDGTEPTEDSKVYTEPIDVTEDCTTKAFATLPGYYDSDVVTVDVKVLTQAAAPTISVAQNGEKATVTLSGKGTIYFNFSGQAAVAASAVYTEPFDVDRHVTVTAFITEEGKLQSETVTEKVIIEGFKYNKELAHFDANKETYYTPYTEVYTEGLSANKAMYYFGKSAQNCYTEEIIGTKEVEVKDEEGNVTGTETVNVYAIAEPTTIDFADGWTIGTSGQVVTWTSDAPSNAAVADESNRYPGSVFDWGATITPNITFGGCMSGTENTAFIQTTEKLQAPFQIEAYVGNGHSSSQPSAELQVSSDGKNWTKIADCNIWPVRRCYMRTAAVYEGTDEVYVRLASTGKTSSAMVYDIYINGVGELDAIEAVVNDTNFAQTNFIYNLSGQRVGVAYKGIVIKNGKKVMMK